MADALAVRELLSGLMADDYGRLVASFSVRTRDVAAAEDAVSEAFSRALRLWPVEGIPEQPTAWLRTVARRKWIDDIRRQSSRQPLHDMDEFADLPEEDRLAQTMADDRLPLMFACAHPAIDPSLHAPLILQSILGVDAASIASAFLVSPTTMGQRLVRAKNKLRDAGVAFELPEDHQWKERLSAVLDAIYVAYTLGWDALLVDQTGRRELSAEAIRLARLVVRLLPAEPEPLGLLALMLYAESRQAARRDEQGRYVPLLEQDPAQWDGEFLREAEGRLFEASRAQCHGRFQLEAAIQSAHARRYWQEEPAWGAIVDLYAKLLELAPSWGAAVGQAAAVMHVRGPEAALALLDERQAPGLMSYQPYWAVRGHVLARLGRLDDASAAWQQAIGLTDDPDVRHYLLNCQQRLSGTSC